MLMKMYDPLHPGEFIKETYLEPFAISQNKMAEQLDVAWSTFSRLVRGDSNITPEMAIRLSKVIGRSPESWLAMQAAFDLYHANRECKSLRKLKPLDVFKDDSYFIK